MPLLAQDEFGRVYQTEGLSEFDEGQVGYFAEVDDTDNVYFGEMGNREQRRLQNLRKFRARQARLRQIKHAKKLQALRNQKAAIAKRNAAFNAKVRAAQDRTRKRIAAMKLARIKGSKNAFAGYEQQTVGNPLAGWSQGQAIMKPGDWKNVGISGVSRHEEFGIGTYHRVDHPLMGFSPYDSGVDGMGFKIKKFKIKLPKIKVKLPSISKVVKDIGKLAGSVVNAPLKLSKEILTNVPIVKDVYKGVDKLTGGTLSSLHRTVMLPGDAMQGKKITKAMFMEGLMNIIKVGAIVVTGGAAASVVGAASGALAQGPLGKTSFGRAVLSIGEIASLSSLGKVGLAKALEKKATDMVAAQAASAAGKKAGVLGAIVAGAAVSATAGGFTGDGGKAPVIKADANSVAKAAKAADSASQIAAKGAIEALKKGELKFDTKSAQAAFIKEAEAAAKKKVAQEFQKKTGIPFDLASDLAKGKVPTTEELKNRVKNEFYGTINDLEGRIAQIPSQISNAEPLMKKALEEKAKLLAAEVASRKNIVAQLQKQAGEELAKTNQILKEKALFAQAKQETVMALGKRHDQLAEQLKKSGANLAEREKLTKELAFLQAQLLKEADETNKAIDVAENLYIQSEYEKDKGAVKALQAEFGGPGAREKYLSEGSSEEYLHPMLKYNLVERKV